MKTILLWLFTATIALAQTPASRPNIIFILVDDMAQADLGCYGNPYNQTPNIDKLARSGIRFTQAYAACPVCSPSRASIMTGKYPARLKFTNFQGGERKDSTSPINPANWVKFLPASETTMAERLKALGYQTGFVGKWHLGGPGDETAPWGQGFDYARMIGKNGLDYYNYGIFEGSYTKTVVDRGRTYLTDKLTDYALDFIQSAASKKQPDAAERSPARPFYLYLCYSAPHVLIIPRGDKVAKYLWKYEQFGGMYNPYYAAMIESVDEGVGRIRALLEAQGMDKNTMIVFTSDNGGLGIPELGPIPTQAGHLRKWKGFTYEGGTRVPALVSWPDQIKPDQTCSHYFINSDYTPTFLEALGQSTDGFPDAKSIFPILKNPAAPFDRGPIYWHYPHFSNQTSRPAAAIRQGDWKVIRSYETNQPELYNIREAETEPQDLSKKYPQKVKELNQQLTNWLTALDANMPISKATGKPIQR